MHIITRVNQFVYKEGISTIDAIIKIDQYIEQANQGTKILLMGRPMAFDALNRTMLWAALYKNAYRQK